MITLDAGSELVKDSLETLKELGINVVHSHIGGSVAINGQGNDVDLIVLVQDKTLGELLDICEPVFDLCGEESYEDQGDFVAFRDGDVNIIIPISPEHYNRWQSALEMCQYLYKYGFTERETRVAVHQIVVDGGLRD